MNKEVEKLKIHSAEILRSDNLTNEQINTLLDATWQVRLNADFALTLQLNGKLLKLANKNNYSRGRALAVQAMGYCYLWTDRYRDAHEAFE